MTKKLCLEEACENTSSSRGLCHKHYMQHRNHGTLEQFGGKIIRHYISNIDPATKTATCSVCGEGQRIYSSGKQWKCHTKVRRRKLVYGGEQYIPRRVIEETWGELNVKQGGLCAKCNKPCSTGNVLSVDHCHETGKIRGLLCGKCNMGIGLLGDTVEGLQEALDYLLRAEA